MSIINAAKNVKIAIKDVDKESIFQHKNDFLSIIIFKIKYVN